MKKADKKSSMPLRFRYTLLLAAVMLLLIASLWAVNRYYLQRYYQTQKMKEMKTARTLMTGYLGAPGRGERAEKELELRKFCEAQGMSALVLQDRGIFSVIVFSTTDSGGAAADRLLEQTVGRGSQPDQPEKILESGEGYRIYRVRDAVTATDQIDCIGEITVREKLISELGRSREQEETYLFVLTMPLAGIAESVALSNRFLLAVGLVISLLGMLLMYLAASRLTRPIRELSGLSERMQDLDLKARYEGSSQDELGILGANMNRMAERLEQTITDLKEANARLEGDIREKERINRQQKELLVNISHELKTPIALVEGYAEGIKDGVSTDPEMTAQYIDVILDESARMNRLVSQLLRISEMESGTVSAEKDAFDLAEMLQGLLESIRLSAEEKRVRLQSDIPDSLPLESDEFLLEQVVRNYLSNALHYVNEGGVIRLSAGISAQDRAVIRVYNSGSHIPEEALPEIWNKFYKVDKARTRAYGGSGIGLSVVKASAELLGGNCGVNNTADGVEFYFEFDEAGRPKEDRSRKGYRDS